MANTTKLMRERLELARFSHRNGRPAAAFHALADVVDLMLSRLEAAETAPAVAYGEAGEQAAPITRTGRRSSRQAQPAAAGEALPLGGGV